MMDRDIKIFLLRTLLAANGAPITNDTLVAAIANAFGHVALTANDIRQYIADTETQNLIAGTNDELLGIVWALTPKGKIRAQSLPR